MKIVRFKDLKFIPASHEDPQDPGALKKVLVKKEHLVKGRVQMINWAKLPVAKSFAAHYHQDMEEVFVLLEGMAEVKVDNEKAQLEKGDVVIIPTDKVHGMKNIGNETVEYIALGISCGQGGRTIVV